MYTPGYIHMPTYPFHHLTKQHTHQTFVHTPQEIRIYTQALLPQHLWIYTIVHVYTRILNIHIHAYLHTCTYVHVHVPLFSRHRKYLIPICIYILARRIHIHMHIHVHNSCSTAWVLQLLRWKYSDHCTLGMYVTYKTHSYRPIAQQLPRYVHFCTYVHTCTCVPT